MNLWEDNVTGLTQAGTYSAGQLEYSNGKVADIRIPINLGQAQYQPQLSGQQPIMGVYLPADRPEFAYSQVQQIPVRPRQSSEAFSLVENDLRQVALSQGGQHSTVQHMKEVLVGLAVFGYGNPVVDPDSSARRLFEGFQDTLRKILPRQIGFSRLAVRNSEVVLETESGAFLLDAVSGGVGALLTLGWLIYMYAAFKEDEFTVVLDEPENHLHPGMQREVLPSLLNAFPKATFLVATHSPLVVSSVPEAQAYALMFSEDRKVVSEKLDLAQTSGSASEVLQKALDVPSTYPIWVEKKFDELVAKYMREGASPSSITELKADLDRANLGDLLPVALLRQKRGGKDR